MLVQTISECEWTQGDRGPGQARFGWLRGCRAQEPGPNGRVSFRTRDLGRNGPTGEARRGQEGLDEWLRRALKSIQALSRQLHRACPAGTQIRFTVRRVLNEHKHNSSPLVTDEQVLTLAELTCPAVDDAYKLIRGVSGGPAAFDESLIAATAEQVGREIQDLRRTRELRSGDGPILLDGEASGLLACMGIGYLLEADRLLLKTSKLRDSWSGQAIGPPGLCVWDDPTHHQSPVHFTRDDEGTRTQPVCLVWDGVLATPLTDTRTARALELPNNGHSRAQDYRDAPTPRVANVFIAGGADDEWTLCQRMGNGLYGQGVRSAAVDVASGVIHLNFRLVYQIEAGERAYPVRSASLSLCAPDFWRHVIGLGREVTFHLRFLGKGRPLQTLPVSIGGPHVLLERAYVR